MTTTVFRTNTLVLPPETLTRSCPNGATQTRTSYVTGQTVVITSIATRTETVGGGAVSRTTTVTRSASCHLPDKRRGLAARETAAGAAAAAPAAVAATTVTVTQTTFTATSTRYTTVPAATTATETSESVPWTNWRWQNANQSAPQPLESGPSRGKTPFFGKSFVHVTDSSQRSRPVHVLQRWRPGCHLHQDDHAR